MASPPSKYINNPNNDPSPVRTFHTDIYLTISELSLPGKNVTITGGGTGIGRETVRSFAKAGAASVFILGGRRANLLEEVEVEVEREFPGTRIDVCAVDVTDKKAVVEAAKSIEGWDILVLNSAYLSNKGNLESVDLEDWWRAFEVALKGTLIILQTLLPKRRPGAAIIATSSLVITYHFDGYSSYMMLTLALTKMMESLAAENEDLHVVSFHSGGDMYDKFFGNQADANKG